METTNFLEFGRQNSNCYVMDEGFTLWKIIRKENELPVFRGENGNDIFVHILVLSGEIMAEWKGIQYPLTKNSFSDFMDGRSLIIRDMSEDIQAYVLFFTAPLIASLMKNTPPFPPSYVLRTKAWPVSVLSSEATERIQKKNEQHCGVFKRRKPPLLYRNDELYFANLHDGHSQRIYPAGKRRWNTDGS